MSLGDPVAEGWSEIVAVLPTDAEREELARFIREDLRHGAGTGILRGLFLFLKANRIFMESMPGRFRDEFTRELTEAMLRLEKTLAIALQGHKDGIASLERSAARAEAVAQFIEKIGPDIRAMFQTAADRIDVKQIAQNLTDTMAKSTVEPVARTNKELRDTLELFRTFLASIEQTTKALRNLSFPGIAAAAFLLAFLICSSLSAYIVLRIDRAYDQRLAAAVETNGPAFAQLARLHAKIEVVPQGDAQGNPIPERWALSLDGADTAQMKTNDPRQRGVIFFEGPSGQ